MSWAIGEFLNLTLISLAEIHFDFWKNRKVKKEGP